MMEKYPFNDENYLRFSELIQVRTGIRVVESRREVLARALMEHPESVECADLDQLFSCLQDARTDSEVWDDLIKKVTIGETYFFRDSDHIESLRRNILPDLIARHQTDRTLRLWSAGCATGEEPYTLAILLRQILFDIDQWNILILATDINRQALLHAAAGRYRPWSFRETDPAVRSSYFIRDGDTYILEPAVREMVTFAYHNLVEENFPSSINQTSNLDLILCRNVSIYLPKSLIQDIANRFYRRLSNGGWLIVGPSETHAEIYRQFQVVNFHRAIAYQRNNGIPASSSSQTTPPEQISCDTAPFQPDRLPPILSNRDGGLVMPQVIPTSSAAMPQSPAVNKASDPSPQRILPSNAGIGNAEWTDLYEQGETFMKQHRYDEARQCFLSCLAKEAPSITALYRMACLEANSGRLNEAQKWAERALDQDPLRSEVHYTLALVHEVQGELKEAINRLKKVIYLDPNFILAHFGLFHLYQRTRNPNEAERHRILAVYLASRISSDTVLPGSDDLTAGQLLTMAQAVPQNRSVMLRGKS